MNFIPGLPATHRVVSDKCRERGESEVIDECMASVEKALSDLFKHHAAGNGTRFHVAVTVEYAETEQALRARAAGTSERAE